MIVQCRSPVRKQCEQTVPSAKTTNNDNDNGGVSLSWTKELQLLSWPETKLQLLAGDEMDS